MDHMTVRPVPIGLAYVAAHIDTSRHTLQVLDLMFAEKAILDSVTAVHHFQPDVIGLSLRNLDNQSYLHPVWHLPAVKELIGHLRAMSPATIVCGGPAFSILPAACFDYLTPDLGLAGHAVASFGELVECLAARTAFGNLPGLIYRDGANTVVREELFTTQFHTPPRLDLLDLPRYKKAGFGIGVVTKLAPYYYATADGPGQRSSADWRMRPAADVLDEVRRLRRDHDIRKFFFIDSGFNMPLHHAKALCQALIEANLGLRWNSYLRLGECDAELIELMKRSGCSLALLAGTEGYSAEPSDVSMTLEQVGRLSALCRQGGLPFTLAIGFGLPGESRSTVDQKLAFLHRAAPASATLRVASRVLPRTPLAKLALEEGLIRAEADLIRPTFYLAASVRDWLVDHLRAAAESEPRWHLL
jgi:radical SAM superfamily enzyme YgiQ (UPF0313 family)